MATSINLMVDKSKLAAMADLISDQISISGIDRYCTETGICKEDFIEIKPNDFQGMIFAIDGSNLPVCDWSVASLNKICAGFAVYKGRDWQRTVITYDDIFLADQMSYNQQFEPYLKSTFGIGEFILKDSELERLSTYFRELQEYMALFDAIVEADKGDLILYDGGFTWKDRPLGEALRKIFWAAEKKGVDLMGISKSSSISWGEGISRPFVQHTSYVGSILVPGVPWYVSLKGKKIMPEPDWEGETFIARFNGCSENAFRVDVPYYLVDSIDGTLGKLVMNSCSAECLGYPHALFRAHRDIRITEQEGIFLRMALLDMLSDKGLSQSHIRNLLADYHEIIEMKPKI